MKYYYNLLYSCINKITNKSGINIVNASNFLLTFKISNNINPIYVMNELLESLECSNSSIKFKIDYNLYGTSYYDVKDCILSSFAIEHKDSELSRKQLRNIKSDIEREYYIDELKGSKSFN
ncbi:hypothetical protein D3C81_1982080 [compost metagenome]